MASQEKTQATLTTTFVITHTHSHEILTVDLNFTRRNTSSNAGVRNEKTDFWNGSPCDCFRESTKRVTKTVRKGFGKLIVSFVRPLTNVIETSCLRHCVLSGKIKIIFKLIQIEVDQKRRALIRTVYRHRALQVYESMILSIPTRSVITSENDQVYHKMEVNTRQQTQSRCHNYDLESEIG